MSTTTNLQLLQEKYLDQYYSLEDDYDKEVADGLEKLIEGLRDDNRTKKQENKKIRNKNAQLLHTRRARLYYNLLLVQLITSFETYCQDCFIEAIANNFEEEELRIRIQDLNLKIDPWELLHLAENDYYLDIGLLIADNYKFRIIDQPHVKDKSIHFLSKTGGAAKAYNDVFETNIYNINGIESSHNIWMQMKKWFTMRHINVHNNGRVQKVEDEKYIDYEVDDVVEISIEDLNIAIDLFSKIVWSIEKQMSEYFLSNDDIDYPYFSDEELEE